ncbi:MAG: glycoside hydrolase family 1 protein [Myxococcota bacterium]
MRRFRFLALPLALCACPPSPSTPDAGKPFVEGTFPAGFWWGSSVAGFQVEAGCPTVAPEQCEDRNSDWYAFVMSPEMRAVEGNHLAGHDVSMGPGFYETYADDVARAKNELGSTAFRFGLEWSRIFPTSTRGISGYDALKAAASADGLAYYHRVLDAVRAAGLQPLVTINHYTLPTWIHDAVGCNQDFDNCSPRGWLEPGFIDELAKFSGFVAQEYGSKVDFWATQNEPLAVVLAGYVFPSETRTNPPAVSFQLREAREVMANMQVAHARQYDAVKAADSVDADGDGRMSQVGIVYNMAPSAPKDPNNPGDVQAAEDIYYLYNTAFLNGVVKGDFDPDLDGVAEHRDDMAGRMDYLGINYYTRVVVQGSSDGQPAFPELSPLTAFDPLHVEQGADYARGIYEVAMKAKEYGIPLYITENGKADPDDDGSGTRFLVEHLTLLARAIRDGADVRGYFWWTLMDNYEWNHGMGIRMGLYAVDPADPTKTRRARKTVAEYRKIAAGNAVPTDLLQAHPVAQ